MKSLVWVQASFFSFCVPKSDILYRCYFLSFCITKAKLCSAKYLMEYLKIFILRSSALGIDFGGIKVTDDKSPTSNANEELVKFLSELRELVRNGQGA